MQESEIRCYTSARRGKAGARASCCEKADDCKRLAEALLVGFLAVLWLAVLPKEECSAKPGLGGEPEKLPPCIVEPNGLHAPWETCIRFQCHPPLHALSIRFSFFRRDSRRAARSARQCVSKQTQCLRGQENASERHRADKSSQLHVQGQITAKHGCIFLN